MSQGCSEDGPEENPLAGSAQAALRDGTCQEGQRLRLGVLKGFGLRLGLNKPLNPKP